MPENIDHDRLFKELLTTFFIEFVELFLPDVAAYIERDSLVFLAKEVFTDVTSGEKHEVDIVVQARFRQEDTFFLIHVENQSRPQSGFPRRMFRYFARLFERHDLAVYPIVVFSYDRPLRAEPDRFRIAFPNKKVLDFHYSAIQLNRLNWRQFVRQPNPVAASLMAKMKFTAADRPRVKLECLRLLATLQLNPTKARLITGFVHTYLTLNAAENRVFQQEMDALSPEEKQPMLQLTNEWIEEGERRGALQEAQSMLLRLGSKRLGMPTAEIKADIEAISDRERLETWIERVFEIETWQELFTGPESK